jgi:hypothetical protein
MLIFNCEEVEKRNMGRWKSLSIIACLILLSNTSVKAGTHGNNAALKLAGILTGLEALENPVTKTYILNPVDASMPTVNDTGDYMSFVLETWLAFDLSEIPANAQVVSANLSAYLWNLSDTPSERYLGYWANDSWISIGNEALSDPGNNVIPDQIVSIFIHDTPSYLGYQWKTIPISYNGWANDFADGYISLVITGGQSGSVGLDLASAFGIDRKPELSITILWDGPPLAVTSPNGGQSWQAGTMQSITWDSVGAGDNVKIELYKNDSYLSNIIVSTANDGEYTWLIPSNLSAGSNYKIKIIDTSDSSKYGYSDDYFNVTAYSPPSGSLQFKSSSYSVQENGGTIRIYVKRTDGSFGVASVNYATSNGTAAAGSDYTEKTGTLTWSNGDTDDKYFDISITNDDTYEGDETFIVTLKNAIGASLGSPGQTTVIIANDDSPPYNIYLPVVKTLSPNVVTSGTAALVGLLENDGCEEIEENCICRFSYWKSGEQENAKLTDWQSGISQDQKFTATISGLDPDTVYMFCTQASNSAGMSNGNTLKFKTSPDPNLPPAAFEPNEPNTLLIENFVKVQQKDPNKPHENQGFITYAQGIGLDGIDPNDVLYFEQASAKKSKIVSVITKPAQKGQKAGFYELSKDGRPNNAQDSLLELSIFCSEPNDPNITSENYLKFWLADNAFIGKTVTIQKVSSEPNITYPLWDVNEIISKNSRKMPLSKLGNQKLNTPYVWFTLSTNRQILDLNEDGIVDLTDYALLMADAGRKGIYRSDIASPKDSISVIGIPDGNVNDTDIIAFINEYNKKHPANPISYSSEKISEGFENDLIPAPFVTSGNSPWIIDSNCYGGQLCVKSGDISHSQSSILEVTTGCATGKISFYMKISSESYGDYLIFYIDGVVKEKWSGFLGWEEMSYQVAPGNHTFRWEYKKDWGDWDFLQVEDAAWIDDINIE